MDRPASTPPLPEWTDRLSTLAADPMLRRKMGEAGRLRAAEEYSLQRNALRYVHLHTNSAP